MEEIELSQCIELNQQATMLMAVEKYNEAITYLEKALEMIDQAEKMEGFEVEARNLSFEKAKIYAQKEDVDNSIKYLEKCISYEEGYKDYEVRFFLMNAYLAIENYEKVYENANSIAGDENGPSEYIMAAMYYKALSLK